MSLKKRSRFLSILFAVIAFGLLGWQIIRDWDHLPPGFFQDVRLVPLAGSLFVLVLALFLVSLRWGLTLQAMGVPINQWEAVRIWFLSQTGRYAPGGIWNYVARFYLGKDEIPKQAVVASMILETGLRVASEMLVFLISVPFWPQKVFFTTGNIFLIAGGAVIGLGLLYPAFMWKLANSGVLRCIGLKAAKLSKVKYHIILMLLFYYMLSVLIVGGAFFLLVSALYSIPTNFFLPLTGSFAISMVIGFLFPLAPNGWGVREGVLVFLLTQMLPAPISIVIAMVSRIWLVAGEIFWVVVTASFKRRKRYS